MIFENLEKELLTLIADKNKIILGLSGGPDSVFLFYFLCKLHNENKITLICAHLDHEWRKESYKDVIFCKKLCKKNNIKFIDSKASELNLKIKFNGSNEEIGRKLRHHFFKKILNKEKANYIALAHHLQDQQETFLWRIIRGTTLTGLSCMKKVENPYIRPILDLDKKYILDYLNKNKIEYLIDETNESDKYLRNKIRKYIIPQFLKCDSRFDKKFLSTLKQLQSEENFLKSMTEKSFSCIFVFSKEKNKYIGNIKEFLSLDTVLKKRIIILWFCKENLKFNLSNNLLDEIIRFLKNTKGGGHQIAKNFKINKKKNSFEYQSLIDN